ncbi:hypothetical protein BT96DRAFT_1018754 [Gymnopus androsaceus JB14]|uniref:Uncharacterized protein n=1 Tax=Gymnopus androsaceus JB14 TaxID=1447944 RepID=A0A6A4HR27_9AGAR|nr:hypothetical protein BT96DRAFT_1018754 [Gymnopus androsaceus JB14]
MSFQHFRLGEMAMANPPPHLMHLQGSTSNIHGHPQQNQQSSQFATIDNTNTFSDKISPGSSTKSPYGSGLDTDDGYTLVFANIAAFHEWRAAEEEAQVVDVLFDRPYLFNPNYCSLNVQGDTHGSKAIPPRFKDHTKLVCARHSRSGRKKYVKKHPDRVRKVPSRKLEGQGCPASISFKTYFDTEEVRACYNSQHSHEIGAANLPFTRRGRKAAAEAEKTKSNKHIRFANDDSSANNTSSPPPIAGPSSVPQSTPPSNYSSSVSMIAPLPSGQTSYQATPQTYNFQPPYQYAPAPAPVPTPVPPPVHPPPTQHTSDAFSADRWQNMETLFQSVRENARSFAYPTASVAVLETVLIRLFLEGPQPVMSQQPMAVSSMSQSMSARMENEDGSSDE